MRITIVTGFFLPVPPLRGGATERSWYGLAERFAAAGHRVTFLSRKWPGLADRESVKGVDHLRIAGFDHHRSLALNLVLDGLWAIRVMRSLPHGDIVVCNTISLPALLRMFVPSAGKVAVMIGRTPKGQVSFYRHVARIYLPSSSVFAQVRQRWAINRVRVIGYPIDWHSLVAASSQTGHPVTIGYVGRLHPEKGLEVLLRAARLLAAEEGLPKWQLLISGPENVNDGGGGTEWVQILRSESTKLLGNRILWFGPEFDPERLAARYGSIDVFCYPSLASKGETFGVSVAEAMAAGCAVVVSALPCFSDLVTHGNTGLVFDHTLEKPENALRDCLRQLVAGIELRREISSRGQLHAKRYDYAQVSQNILNDLESLTAADSRP